MKHLKNAKEIAAYRKANKPRLCPVMGNRGFSPAVDHCHQTGVVRGVISLEANSFEGRVRSAFRRHGYKSNLSLSEVLRNLADYLDKPPLKIMHPKGLRQICARFGRLPKRHQLTTLMKLGATDADLEESTTPAKRRALYKKLVME